MVFSTCPPCPLPIKAINRDYEGLPVQVRQGVGSTVGTAFVVFTSPSETSLAHVAPALASAGCFLPARCRGGPEGPSCWLSLVLPDSACASSGRAPLMGLSEKYPSIDIISARPLPIAPSRSDAAWCRGCPSRLAHPVPVASARRLPHLVCGLLARLCRRSSSPASSRPRRASRRPLDPSAPESPRPASPKEGSCVTPEGARLLRPACFVPRGEGGSLASAGAVCLA